MSQTIAVVVGTRPEAIKMAPLVLALRDHPRYRPVLISTAQHTEMLGQALGTFGLIPDINLGLARAGDSLEGFLGRALEPLGRVFGDLQPALTLVQGDTMSVLAAAQASFFRGLPLGHVEAGLRTQNMGQPFPEEGTRRLVSVVASLHFAPTERARNNLLREGIDPAKVWITGNTGIDAMRALRFAVPENERIRALDFDGTRVLLMTAHRRENHGKPLTDICTAVRSIVERFDDVHVVVPVHANPSVGTVVNSLLGDLDRVHLLPPLNYGDLVYVMRRCTLILTDSGGIQEEAPSCNCPVLILRNVTERPEVVEVGAGMLLGTEPKRIVDAVSTLLADADAYDAMSSAPNPFGDGYASERIVRIIDESFERRRVTRAS